MIAGRRRELDRPAFRQREAVKKKRPVPIWTTAFFLL